jgi:hypothetical protein
MRVLRPGGLFVLTFDLSLDGRHTLRRDVAERLLDTLTRQFLAETDIDPKGELARMSNPGILSTDHVRATEPELLPCRTF